MGGKKPEKTIRRRDLLDWEEFLDQLAHGVWIEFLWRYKGGATTQRSPASVGEC